MVRDRLVWVAVGSQEARVHYDRDDDKQVKVVIHSQQVAIFVELVVSRSYFHKLELLSFLLFEVRDHFMSLENMELGNRSFFCILNSLRKHEFDHVDFFNVLSLNYVAYCVKLF